VAPNVRSDGAGTSASDPLALLLILVWPISSYWFIYALFIFTLIVWLFRKAPVAVLLVLSGILGAFAASGVLDVDNVGLNRMAEYLFFFVVGAAFHRRIYSAVEATKPWKTLVLALAFAAYSAAVFLVSGLGRIPGVALVGEILVVAAVFSLSYYLVRLRFVGWVSYIGQRALNIYLVHIFVIALLAAGLGLIPGITSPLPDRGALVLTLATAVVIVISIVVARYLTKVSWLFVYPFRARTPRAIPESDRKSE